MGSTSSTDACAGAAPASSPPLDGDAATTLAVRAAAHHRGFFRPELRFPNAKFFRPRDAASDGAVTALARRLRLHGVSSSSTGDVAFAVALMVSSLSLWRMRALQTRLGLTREDLALIRDLVQRS